MTALRRLLLVLLLAIPWYALETPLAAVIDRLNGPGWALWLLMATPYVVMLVVFIIWERPTGKHARSDRG